MIIQYFEKNNLHTKYIQFLIDQSTEYTQYVAQQAEIDELLEEINELRAQNLELVNDVILATEAISNLETNLNG